MLYLSKMKNIVFIIAVALLQLVQGNALPKDLQDLVCRKSDPDYSKCLWTNVEKAMPRLAKGSPELNLPAFDPFEMPLMTVDQTLNELVSIKAVLRNIKYDGFNNLKIEHIEVNPETLTGEVRYTIPWSHLEMEYNVNGQLLIIPLRSKGFFEGNFTDVQVYLKGSLKYVDVDNEKYFRTDKLGFKATVGDGHINLISKNPNLQFAADLISNFYNQNPRLVMDAVNPIFIQTSRELFRVVIDQVLASIPAKEWLPE